MTSLVPGGWSIGVEMLSYLMVPVLFRRLRTINHALFFFLASVVLSNVWSHLLEHHRLITDPSLWSNFITLSFPSQLPFFALGIVLYFVLFRHDRRAVSPMVWILLCAFLIMSATISPTGRQTIYYLSPEVEFGLAFVLLFVAVESGRIRVLSNAVTAFIGRISYSMYFVQFAVLHYMSTMHLLDYISVSDRSSAIANYLIRLLVLIAASTILSLVLFKLVETPFQDIAQRIVLRREARGALRSANLRALGSAEPA